MNRLAQMLGRCRNPEKNPSPARRRSSRPLGPLPGAAGIGFLVALCWPPGVAPAQVGQPAGSLRSQSFDRDPAWEGLNNRSKTPEPRRIRQDFGYRRPAPAGPGPAAVGGFVTPAAEPAHYGMKIPPRTLDQVLEASGSLVVSPGGTLDDGAGNTLVGLYNDATLNEWRTPNTIALRVNGRGDGFHLHVEYCTALWRAGGDFFAAPAPAGSRRTARLVPSGPVVHRWSLRYDPAGHNGDGTIAAVLDGESLVVNLDPGHRRDGATFNRFGLVNVMKSADSGGTLWIGSLKVNGADVPLDQDRAWSGENNRRTYTSTSVRPRFDFGFSATNFAAGKAAGEIGGLIFRGDQRYPERLAAYGDRLEPLSLAMPLEAAGRIVLRRGVTDSTVLIGFYHSRDSVRVGPEQVSGLPENFLGVCVEGPSREGFLFYPAYGVDREGLGAAPRFDPLPPHILPDGRAHPWALNYDPAAGPAGRITASLDGKTTTLDLRPDWRALGAHFDRFGFVTTHIDGNGQLVYLDDLTYTWRQASAAPGGAR